MKRLGIIAVALTVLLGTSPVWKPVAKRHSKWAVVATNVYQDLLRRTGLKREQIGNPYTSVHRTAEIDPYLWRIDNMFRNYLDRMGIPAEALRGKRMLEVGPGDNIGLELRFIAAGAAQAVAVDKFVPLQTSPFHRALYAALRERLTDEERRNLDEAVDLSTGVRFKSDRLLYISGHGVEDVDAVLPPASMDVIVSNAVLEEVYPIDRALAALDRVWRPGGYQVHKIDLRDYGMFSKYGYHPLEFLTIPDPVYRLMVESTGQPNRRLVDYYRGRMASRGYPASIYTTWVLGSSTELVPPKDSLQYGVDYSADTLAKVERIRPRLLERYRRLPDEDLIVQGIVLVARKPARSNAMRLTTEAAGQ